MNIGNNKPIDVNVIIKTSLVFYEEPPKKDTFGSNDIIYEVYYDTKRGIMSIEEIDSWGDRTLIGTFNDKRGRGITLNEMLENIQEMANMTYTEFKELINKKGSDI